MILRFVGSLPGGEGRGRGRGRGEGGLGVEGLSDALDTHAILGARHEFSRLVES